MKITQLLKNISFSAIIIFCSCKKEKDVDPYEFTVNEISIKDSTKLLFATTPEESNLGMADSNELFQISSKDLVSKFKINSSTGNNVSSMFKPAKLSNVSEKYFMMTISRNTGSGSEGYLLNKSTNELISISPNRKVPVNGGFADILNHPFTLNDGKGSVYYIAYDVSNGNSSLAKININNPSASTITYLTPDSIKRVTSFDVDKDGNIMADVDGVSRKRWFMVFNANTMKIVPDFYPNQYFVGPNGYFYYPANGYMKKCEYNSGSGFSFSNYYDLLNNGLNSNFYRENLYRIQLSDKLVVLNDNTFFEFSNTANTIKKNTSVPLLKTKWIDHSKALGHLYVAGESASGQETIFNIDLSNYSYTTYPAPGKYNFYEIEAFEDGTIYATAKRKSDSKNVVLKFAPDGTETVLYDQLGTKKGIWLEKVTEYVND
jgi:hypothetical protein